MAKSVLINILGNPASALAALEEVGIKAQETAKKTAEVGHEGDGASSKLKAFGLGAAGSLIIAGVAAVDMGNHLEDAHAALVTAIKDAGGQFNLLQPAIAATDKRMESLGFTNADTEAALASMTIGLHSGSEAMALIGLAADIARARHIDLATAGTLVTKAFEGQTIPLRRAGIDLPILSSSSLKVQQAQAGLQKAQEAVNAILAKFPDAANPASKAHAQYEAAVGKVATAQTKLSDLQLSGKQIIEALTQRYGGQATAAADTFSGRMEVMRARITDLGAKIGEALIPILEKLMSTIAKVVGWFEKHRTAALLLAGVITGVLIGAAVAWVAALSPITLTIGAIVLLVGGMIAIGLLLKANWDKVLGFLRSGFGTLVQVILLGPFAIITLLALHWKTVWDGMKDAVNGFVSFFGGIVHWFSTLPGTIVGFFSGVGDGIASFFEQIPGRIWNNVILPIWNFFVTLPGSIVKLFEHLGQDIINAIKSNIPGSGILSQGWHAIFGAEGGLITSPTLLVAGEAGPEVLIPLDKLGGAGIDGSGFSPGVSVRSGGSPGGAGGGGDLVIALDGREFARVAGPDLRTWLLQGAKKNATRVGLA